MGELQRHRVTKDLSAQDQPHQTAEQGLGRESWICGPQLALRHLHLQVMLQKARSLLKSCRAKWCNCWIMDHLRQEDADQIDKLLALDDAQYLLHYKAQKLLWRH